MTYDSENNRSAPADWNDSADDTGATDADVDADADADVDADGWDNQPNFAAGASRSPGLLAWVAGGVVLALIVLALIWGISGFGRVEPTATPTPTLVTVFQATATPTMLAGAVITPTADLSFTATPTPAPIPATQIRMGGRVRVVNANPEGISVRFGAGQGTDGHGAAGRLHRSLPHDSRRLHLVAHPHGRWHCRLDGFRLAAADQLNPV